MHIKSGRSTGECECGVSNGIVEKHLSVAAQSQWEICDTCKREPECWAMRSGADRPESTANCNLIHQAWKEQRGHSVAPA
jgi:hypothetical protein